MSVSSSNKFSDYSRLKKLAFGFLKIDCFSDILLLFSVPAPTAGYFGFIAAVFGLSLEKFLYLSCPNEGLSSSESLPFGGLFFGDLLFLAFINSLLDLNYLFCLEVALFDASSDPPASLYYSLS